MTVLQVLKKRCPECLFSENKIVSDARREDVIQKCVRTDSHFVCHRSTMQGGDAVCRGFYDSFSTNLIRVMGRLGGIEFIDVPASVSVQWGALADGVFAGFANDDH